MGFILLYKNRYARCVNAVFSIALNVYLIKGPAAFRGKTGDCEQRSLSGDDREVHISSQVQKGESMRVCCVQSTCIYCV